MKAKLKKIISQLVSFWKSLSKKIQIAAIGTLIGSAVLICIIVLLANRVAYSPLYLGLDTSEAGTIYDKVEAMGVPIKIEGTGNLYVDSRQVDTVKMKLAEAGYPKSTNTYDTFAKGNSWAMTDSDKRKYALYQLQDSLAQTIETIPGVSSAQIAIAMEDNDSYVLSNDQVPVTASVKLNLVTGASLTEQQVKGISLLVAKSVPNLSQSNVAVLDSDGVPLSSQDAGGTSSNLELQEKVENSVKSKILSVLEPIFGSGKVKVAASATLDFSQTVTSKTTYSPNSATGTGVPQNTNTTTQVNSGAWSSSAASGVAGISGNGVAQYTAGTSSQTANGGLVTNQQTNYLVDTINQQIQDQGGKVAKLTVAVVLDNKSTAAATDTGVLKQTVAYAVGIDPASVSIQLASFAQAAAQQSSQAPLLSNPAILAAAGGAVLLIAIFIAVLVFTMRGRHRQQEMAAAAEAVPEASNAVTVKAAPGGQPAAPVPEQKSIEEILTNNQNITKKQIEQFADNKPELVAQILRNWLKDQ